MTRSLLSLAAQRVPLPGALRDKETQQWAFQASDALNALPNFSTFSWSSPESNVTAQAPALGFNLAPSSVASGLWFKQTGSGSTGWVAVA
jgi:hypothetical protein